MNRPPFTAWSSWLFSSSSWAAKPPPNPGEKDEREFRYLPFV
jgi:hypothetical protein